MNKNIHTGSNSACVQNLTTMLSNPIVLTVIISLSVSLFISLAVTFILIRVLTNSPNECLPSLVEEAVQREIDKRWRIFEQKNEKDLQKLKQEKPDETSLDVQPSPEKKSPSIILSGDKKEKMDKHIIEQPKIEKRNVKKDNRGEQLVNVKPEDSVFTNMGVSEGKLVIATGNQPCYYREWDFNGEKYYEFFCDEARVKKAIFNRSAVIDPYCDKHPDSSSPDESTKIETTEYGRLDRDYNIIQKAIVKYIK